jgi:hypothetical protein
MKFLLLFVFLGALTLSGADIVIHKPTTQLLGKRIVSRRQPIAGSGVARVEKVPEIGYRFVFAIQNTSANIVKLATSFNHIDFTSEPGKNLFVLKLSHRIMSVKPESGKAFPLSSPLRRSASSLCAPVRGPCSMSAAGSLKAASEPGISSPSNMPPPITAGTILCS